VSPQGAGITLFATRSCPHRPLMESWLKELGADYRLAFVEDHEAEAERFAVHQSPSLVIESELVFQGMPSKEAFRERLEQAATESAGDRDEQVSLERLPPREDRPQVPEPISEEPGLFSVNATWGGIQPMEVAAGVHTVGELEVLYHLRAGLPIVDARTTDSYEHGTIPGAKGLPHTDVVERMAELDPNQPTIFFCNGPQCAQSPWAIKALLDAEYPAPAILYYRGGLHDWLTLGLPTVPGDEVGAV